jgi:hypothetical protein
MGLWNDHGANAVDSRGSYHWRVSSTENFMVLAILRRIN